MVMSRWCDSKVRLGRLRRVAVRTHVWVARIGKLDVLR